MQKAKLKIPEESYSDMVSKLELIISLCDRELLRHPVSKANSDIKNLLDSAAGDMFKAKDILDKM